MLVELRIRDYAVVEDLTLVLGPGLNVLTGETGAGKSIIVGALSLLLGDRASSSVVRAGAQRAMVEGVFDVSGRSEMDAQLEELGYPSEDGHLILRREVAAEGRNRAWVNGSPATASVLGEIGNALVDLHGQHEHQTLLRTAEQRRILDAFAEAEEEARQVAEGYAQVRALLARIEDREARRREVETQADFLRFQLEEIDAANIDADVDEALTPEAHRLEHATELAEGVTGLYEALYGAEDAAADVIAEAQRRLAKLAEFDPALESFAEQVGDAYHAVAEVGRRLGDYASTIEYDPQRLEEVRERLDLLFRLRRKYGPELDDVLGTAERIRAELSEVDDADHDLVILRRDLNGAQSALEEAAAMLSRLRSAGAERLGGAVEKVLPDLGLPGATFEVRLRELDEVGAGGAEAVEFLVAPNPGFDPMPLARVASGGELSRVMLALKAILAGVDRVPILVFDEIDAGIGGVVATAVARKLEDVAARHQVFVVTHLPQLASRAAAHLRVEKEQGEGLTSTRVLALEGDARVEEIARMLGGDPESSASREHARELLQSAPGQGTTAAGQGTPDATLGGP